MLSRTADSLFWMTRYVERAENIARVLYAASRMSLMPRSSAEEHAAEWLSALQATASYDAFFEQYDEATPERVVEFLAFSEANPSSIFRCLSTARANARSVRTALTSDTWEAINSAWMEMQRFRRDAVSPSDINRFTSWVKDVSLQVDGSAFRTMLRNDGYCMQRLGVYIERADATARILDVKYHLLLPEDQPVGGGLDYLQWSSVLRAVSAHTAYHWIYRGPIRPWLVAELLILREEMPRSLASCYANVTYHLDELGRTYGRQGESQRSARRLYSKLRNGRTEEVYQAGLHEFLSEFLRENAKLGGAITEQYLI